jgi:hypothetical protein
MTHTSPIILFLDLEGIYLVKRVSKYVCNLRQVVQYQLLGVTKGQLYGIIPFFCFTSQYQ